MRAVIVLRDDGSPSLEPGTLTRLWGLSLLERNLHTLRLAGIDSFVILGGPGYGALQRYVDRRGLRATFNVNLLRDVSEMETGDERILVLDGELVFDEGSIRQITSSGSSLAFCVDSTPRYYDSSRFTPGGFAGIALCRGEDLPFVLEKARPGAIPPQRTSNGQTVGICDLKGGFWYRVEDAGDVKKAGELLFEKNLTYQESENVLQTVVRRVPAKLLTRLLVRTPVTANQVTLLGFAVYLAAAALFSLGDRWLSVAAAILPLAGTVIDHTDGMVARLKFQTSKYGAWLEHVLDLFAFSSIVLGITYGLYRGKPEAMVWVAGLLALIFFYLHTFACNSYQEIYGKEMSSVFVLSSGYVKGFLRKVYGLGNVIAKPYLLVLAGAVFNVLLWSFWVLAASMGLSTLAALLGGVGRRRSQ